MGEALHLPPGYRLHFDPTGDELVRHYLKKKIKGENFCRKPVAEVDVYKFAPWELPAKSKSGSGDLQGYFLCPVEKKYSRGRRINRETKHGCWKKTGDDSPVNHDKELVGLKKTFVFYKNLDLAATGIQGRRAPRRKRTDWVMDEYSLEDQYMAREGIVENTHVLCMIFEKDGLGPRKRVQYRAPCKEDGWNYDEEDDFAEAVTSAGSLPNNSRGLAAIDTKLLGGTTSDSCSSGAMQSQCERVSAVLNSDASNELSRVSGEENTHVLCVISEKDGLGPRIHAQYRAPIKEDKGNNNGDDDSAEAVTSAGSLPNNSSGLAAIDTKLLGGTTSDSCLSGAMQSQCEGVSAVLNSDASNELSRVLDDILPEVLTSIKGDNPNKNFDHDEHAEAAICLSDIMGDVFEDFPMGYFDIADFLDLPPDSPPT